MQFAGFLQGFADILNVTDIQFGDPDPPDFILTVDAGRRIGIELKRLRFTTNTKQKNAVTKFRQKCQTVPREPGMYSWPVTTYRSILGHLFDQIEAAMALPEKIHSVHSLDEIWLLFCLVDGNPAGATVESACLKAQGRKADLRDWHMRLLHDAVKLAKRAIQYDVVALASGMTAISLRNATGAPLPNVTDEMLRAGALVPDSVLDTRVLAWTHPSHVGKLMWD
jgi:hypothetical protein